MTRFAHQRVDERGLADVGTADDGQLDAVIVRAFLDGLFLDRRRQVLQRQLDQVDDAIAVRCRNRIRLAQAQFVELGHGGAGSHALGLVDRQQHALLAGFAQQLGDLVVMGVEAGSRVHQEHDHVGLGDGLPGLARHFQQDAVLATGSKPPVSIAMNGISPTLPSP